MLRIGQGKHRKQRIRNIDKVVCYRKSEMSVITKCSVNMLCYKNVTIPNIYLATYYQISKLMVFKCNITKMLILSLTIN